MAARKSCTPAEEIKYQHFSDIRKNIQADSQHKTAYLIYTLDDYMLSSVFLQMIYHTGLSV